MAEQQLTFPGWSHLNKKQKLAVQGLLEVIANLENDLEIIEEIIIENSTDNQPVPPNQYQIIDSIDESNSDVEDIQYFIKVKLKRKIQEKPPEVICVLCQRLGKTDGYCTGC